jgi:hypothetical protein
VRDPRLEELWRRAPRNALLFFDPDNGIEVASVRKGHRNSARYLYWDEVNASYRCGHPLLIYKHFPRVQRSVFLETLLKRVDALTGASGSFALFTDRVAYVLVPHQPHRDSLHEDAQSLVHQWSPDSPVYDACLRTSSDGRRISRQPSGVCRAFAISPLAVFIGAGAKAEVSQELCHLQGRSGAGVEPTERGAATPHRF